MPDAPLASVPPLLEVQGVRQTYRRQHGAPIVVLDGVELALRKGEIVGLLGRSGSGKSTLLRIISGLITPTGGSVLYAGQRIDGPADGIAMVFQTFALFPWLTVLENVLVGLEALPLSREEMRKRALQGIDLIGLDGYETAYPRELSGGMRQRVGFARAIVAHPRVLLMDEPFSALDVLTAETLRTDLLDLWVDGRMPIGAVLMVTHNIEEAVLMCDRILLFGNNPGRVIAEFPVEMPHPRNRLDARFRRRVDDIYARMTARMAEPRRGARGAPATAPFAGAGIAMELPDVSINRLAGLIEALMGEPYFGRADLPAIASPFPVEIDDLFPVTETLQLLRFAELEQGDIRLTAAGRRFADLDVDARKRLFAEHLLKHVPLARHIRRVLDERPSRRAPYTRFREELEDTMSENFADETLRAVIGWGRYAEVFAFRENDGAFSLDDPD